MTRQDLFWAQAVAKTARDYHVALVTNHVPSRVIIRAVDGSIETQRGPETQRQIGVCTAIANAWVQVLAALGRFDNMAMLAGVREIDRLWGELDGGLRVRMEEG